MRHIENTHTEKMQKAVSALVHSAISMELVNRTSHHCSGDSRKKVKNKGKQRLGKDSHICMTPAEILLGSASAAVVRFNRL